MSDEIKKCTRCGGAVSPEALQGICPACLLAMNLSAPTEEFGPEGTQVFSKTAPAPSIHEFSKLFPQLEILEPLGRGGMGAVYKARHPKLDRLIALKILLRREGDAGGDKAFAERFCREARALARLSHPGIVSVYDFGEVGGFSYLLMEYVDGLTLRQLLQRGKLQPEEALALVPSICDALQFAHKQGVVHRDIKPENILLDKEGRVKIADFGIAKLVDPGAGQPVLTGGKDVIGTPHYMAPEQIEQPAKVDHRADIFSLGVVLYEMLTGELPLGKFRPPSSKVTVDVRLDEIVLRALEKEPERRYQHVSQVKTDVENFSSTARGPSASPAPDVEKRPRERKSWSIAAGASAASTLFLLATATQVQPGVPLFLTLCGAAGLLTTAIYYARKAWDCPKAASSATASASQARGLPASLLVLCMLMFVQGFYAFLETVLRQQPGLVIFPFSFCLILGAGLLFLKRWARILALAWVWVAYVMYLLLGLFMLRSHFPGSNVNLKMQIMGRGLEDPRYYILAVLLFVSAAFMVPWTHWVLTRDHIKRLFGIESGAPGKGGSQARDLAIGVAVILATVFAWMVMPNTPAAKSTTNPPDPQALSNKWRRDEDTSVKPLDLHLLQIRRVLTDAETNANTTWLEGITPGEPRLPVDQFMAVNPDFIEKATLSDEVFLTAGPLDSGNFSLMTRMTEAAAPLFEEFTRTNIGRRIAVIIDGKIVSAPIVQSPIPSGLGQITGAFTFAEIVDLTARLNRLTRPLKNEFVLPDPSLGQGVLDLDSGRYTGWPREVFDWNEGALERWLNTVGADLFTGVGPAEPTDTTALAVRKMRMIPLPQETWTNLPSRSEALAALSTTNIAAAAHLRPGPMLLAKTEPATYAFCTAAGSVGVMQIAAREGKVALAYKTLAPAFRSGAAPKGSAP